MAVAGDEDDFAGEREGFGAEHFDELFEATAGGAGAGGAGACFGNSVGGFGALAGAAGSSTSITTCPSIRISRNAAPGATIRSARSPTVFRDFTLDGA